MPDYQLFGGVLRSAVAMPELAPAEGAIASWTLRQVDAAAMGGALEVLGREDVDTGVEVALCRVPDGLRLAFDDTGTFDILDQGQRIDWAAPQAPDMEAVRKDILGRVLAVALSMQTTMALPR